MKGMTMTNATTPEGYERIEWADVREDDVLFHTNGDRLTVKDVTDGNIRAVTGDRRAMLWGDFGFSPYRKPEPLPTEPGAYHDKDGKVWELADSGSWPWRTNGRGRPTSDVAEFAPFTRLVPMPTEEDVLAAIEAPEMLDHRTLAEDRAAAVMALLSTEADRG